MPRLARTKPTSRLTLEMADVIRKQIEEIRDATNADSLTEVIRRSLAVYDLFRKASKNGAKIMLETKDGIQEVMIPEFQLH